MNATVQRIDNAPDPDASLVAEVDQELAKTAALVITTDDEYSAAALALKTLAGLKKRVLDWFKEPIDNAHKQHKLLCDRRSAVLAKPEAEEKRLRGAIEKYAEAKERERVRLEREAQAKARKEEEDRIAAEAAQLEASGEKDLAAAVLQQHIEEAPLPVRVASSTPKVAGVAQTETWDFEVVNKDLLPRQFTLANEPAIRAQVKALGEATKIPGVRVFKKFGVRVSA